MYAFIADVHIGVNLKHEDFMNSLDMLFDIIRKHKEPCHCIFVCGDLFDHRLNMDEYKFAARFLMKLVCNGLSRDIETPHVPVHFIKGTHSHDYDQLKLFYHYMDDDSVDVRVVTQIQFEIVKGCRILCIPELYGLDESVYRHFFFESGWYDEAFVHGTFKGSVYGDNVGAGRLLTEEDFIYCTGVAISGHVHKGGCFNGFYYICFNINSSCYIFEFGNNLRSMVRCYNFNCYY